MDMDPAILACVAAVVVIAGVVTMVMRNRRARDHRDRQ
jgi:hypothetical protein